MGFIISLGEGDFSLVFIACLGALSLLESLFERNVLVICFLELRSLTDMLSNVLGFEGRFGTALLLYILLEWVIRSSVRRPSSHLVHLAKPGRTTKGSHQICPADSPW